MDLIFCRSSTGCKQLFTGYSSSVCTHVILAAIQHIINGQEASYCLCTVQKLSYEDKATAMTDLQQHNWLGISTESK